MLVAGTLCVHAAHAQQEPWSQRAAAAIVNRWPAGQSSPANKNDLALLLNGMDAAWYNTADGSYYQYVKQSIDSLIIDPLIPSDGSIAANDVNANSPAAVALGRQALLLYRATQEQRYYKAASLLRRQFSPESAGTAAADLYASGPFYAEYASLFQQPNDFAEPTKRFTAAEGRMSASSHEMAWYLAALVDTLPYYPRNHAGRATLLAILNRKEASILQHQDRATGLWKAGNSDAATQCMLVYALQKGVRLGYLPQSYSFSAARAWHGITSRLTKNDAGGYVSIISPNQEGAAKDNPQAIGAFLLASTEMDLAPEANLARGQTVVIDAWFNSQQRTNAAGQREYFHYKWGDYSFNGFSIFGNIFASHGAALDTLYTAPTVEKLKGAQYYVIVSPDIPVKNPHPNYVQPGDADQVARWVKQGGMLILMENDPANADVEHLDLIADRFGIHFNNVLSHHVVGDDFAAGQIAVDAAGPVFHHPHALYMKDTCTISLKSPAETLLEDKGDIVMASARYGKGFVFGVVDPWLYNEYTDGRKKLPVQDNYAAGKEMVLWLLKQQALSNRPRTGK
jgi:unsaturated rhamnogalacturonyl hydrolase